MIDNEVVFRAGDADKLGLFLTAPIWSQGGSSVAILHKLSDDTRSVVTWTAGSVKEFPVHLGKHEAYKLDWSGNEIKISVGSAKDQAWFLNTRDGTLRK